MIILDTNVLSALMRHQPDPVVRHFDGLGLSLVDPWALRRSRLACAPTATGESTRSIRIPSPQPPIPPKNAFASRSPGDYAVGEGGLETDA